MNPSDKNQKYLCDPLVIGEAAWGVDYLLESYPPRWFHINKKLIYEISKPQEPDKNNEIKVRRFLEKASPEFVSLPEIQLSFGNYKYLPKLEKDKTIHWHVNFADPCLFGFAAGAAFAQDEIQVAEHPVLVSVGTAIDKGDHGSKRLIRSTVEGVRATPVLLEDVPRFCAIDTEGIYGLLFRDAIESKIRSRVTVLNPPGKSNILAMSAPQGTRGTRYSGELIEGIIRTAFAGFRAAVLTSGEVTIHSGFWGCGAFGNNRQLMTAIQILAAGAAGVRGLVFWVPHDGYLSHYHSGLSLAHALGNRKTPEVVKALEERGFLFGAGNGT